LIIDARKGNQAAFKQLIQKYEPKVAATVIGMLGHCPEAEDIGQETFIRFYKSLDKFRGEAAVGTYLTRIAINLSLNEIKRRIRQRKLFSSDASEDMENFPDTKASRNQKEASQMMQLGLQKLKPKFRVVIVLRLIDGYSTQETARILRLPIGTVLSRLARGQQKLKEILEPVYMGKKDNETGESHE
jgi:RNA polymerase sigma-70 factor (ECF subfamily)